MKVDKALLKSKSLTFEDAAEAADMVLLLFQEVTCLKPCDMSLMQFHEHAFFGTRFLRTGVRFHVPRLLTAKSTDTAGRI